MAPTLRVEQIDNKPKSRKFKFSETEDREILSLVGDDPNSVNWDIISAKLGNRTPRQCKDRYNMYLAPGLNKTQWTFEEDNLLILLVSKLGKRWKTIAPSFNGRPEIALKNRYKLLQRRNRVIQPPQMPMYNPTITAAMTPIMNPAPVAVPAKQEEVKKVQNMPEQSVFEKFDELDANDLSFYDAFSFDDNGSSGSFF